tara:strand:- start:430 stop:633 length:204 start_codon:yes stop_codon:yes gene_type:complete
LKGEKTLNIGDDEIERIEVFLCKLNRYSKGLGAIFFESLNFSGEYSLTAIKNVIKEILTYERRTRKR